jgi:hypothetical protein
MDGAQGGQFCTVHVEGRVLALLARLCGLLIDLAR